MTLGCITDDSVYLTWLKINLKYPWVFHSRLDFQHIWSEYKKKNYG